MKLIAFFVSIGMIYGQNEEKMPMQQLSESVFSDGCGSYGIFLKNKWTFEFLSIYAGIEMEENIKQSGCRGFSIFF